MNISIIQAMIDAIDKPAIFINQQYVIEAVNEQYRNTYPVDIIPGKSQCFRVSHRNNKPCDQCGESCPITQCKETGRSASEVHVHTTQNGQSYCDILMRPVYDANGDLLGYLEILDKLAFASNYPNKGKMIGESNAFKDMLNKINRAAKSDIAVLLQGETGTGKELVSHALHTSSHRANKPFVVIECTGLADNLFESELFGYEKGAFTGATANKKGLVETAQGGTLFFDEIGDVPLSIQVKLLRLLETHTYRPVGSVQLKQANFRLVCATHKNLLTLVERGEFRRDLYYRIAGFSIHLPALRERTSDIPLLCSHILNGLPSKKRLHKSAIRKLTQYSYPGNIRELKNIIEQAYLLADEDVIYATDLPECLTEQIDQFSAEKKILTIEEAEAQYLKNVIQNYQGTIDELANNLGVSQRTLYRKLRSHQLKLKT